MSEQRFRAVMDPSSARWLIVDADGHIIQRLYFSEDAFRSCARLNSRPDVHRLETASESAR